MRTAANRVIFGAVVAMAMALPAKAGNLLANGDFSSGNVGFTTDYYSSTTDYTGYAGSPGYPGPYYTIATNPALWNGVPYSPSFGNGFGDHTTGTGLMLIADGAQTLTAGNQPYVVWRETVNVTANTNYGFSGWAAAWGHDAYGDTDPSPANLQLSVNSMNVGNLQLPASDGAWQNLIGAWNSGTSTTAAISIVDTNLAFSGNDFVLDDLSFGVHGTAVPEIDPGSMASALTLLISGMLTFTGRRRRQSVALASR